VLRHFKPKADLLKAVIDPHRRALTHLLLNAHDDPPTESQRRQLMTRLAELFLTHRGVLRLLANDVSRPAARYLELTAATAKDRY
jgi:AcrR family transcriptional regulator